MEDCLYYYWQPRIWNYGSADFVIIKYFSIMTDFKTSWISRIDFSIPRNLEQYFCQFRKNKRRLCHSSSQKGRDQEGVQTRFAPKQTLIRPSKMHYQVIKTGSVHLWMLIFDLRPLDLVESNIHGLNSLQQKECQKSIKLWIFDDPFHMERPE